MGLFGEKSILDEIGELINENYLFEKYAFTPVEEYSAETNVTFEVMNGGEQIASVKIVKTDGEPVDGVNDTYDYDDVYADVSLELAGKEDEYDVESVKKWILGKLYTMGYYKNPAKIDDDEYDVSKYKEEVKDEIDADSELADVKDDVEDVEGEKEFSFDDLEDED